MEFGLSEEQRLLQDSVRRFLEKNNTVDRIHEFVDSDDPRAENVWGGLVELGLAGLLIDEQYDGVGLRLIDAALVAEVLGHFAALTPFVSTMVMAPIAISKAGSDDQKANWLPQIAAGSLVVGSALTEAVSSRLDAKIESGESILNGKALFVLDFEADMYLVADSSRALYLVEANAPGLKRTLQVTIDKSRKLGQLEFENVKADKLPGSDDAQICTQVVDAGRIILAADTLGASQNMLNQAVAYSKQREQFGRVIGSFQAVKHMCAEMAAHLEPCRAMMWYAAHAYDEIPDETRLTTCHAKAHISEVAKFVARTSTEVHGGIGFTHELGLHYWFKRIGANRQLLGGPELLREEAAGLQGLV